MNKLPESFKALFVLSFVFLQVTSYGQNTGKPKLNWSLQNPLSQKVFIENSQGQFDKQTINGEKVYYKTTLKGVDIYFTDKGILYSHSEKIKGHSENEKEDADPDRIPVKVVRHTAQFQWKGANAVIQFTPEDEVSFYYTYSKDSIHTSVAHAFKKIRCQNLYQGIDVEYSFPEGENSLACTIHMHPGADSNNIKLVSDGFSASPLYGVENVFVKNEVGDFTLSKHTTSATSLWITNPGFKGYDGMYDLCYDDSGNVFVYGGNGPYQLAKINSSGSLKWIYNVNFPSDSESDYFYGDFVTDKNTGTSYIGEAVNDSLSGPEIRKINSSGVVVGSVNLGQGITEIWRMDLNYCTHQIVIGGGGVHSLGQAAIIDTSLSGISEFNLLGATEGKNDIALLTCDRKQPYCYMAVVEPNDGTPGFGNSLFQCPIPSLSPPSYVQYDGYGFQELFCNQYVTAIDSILGIQLAANGMNGIVATTNNLYLWDGYKISSFNKNSGSLLKTKSIYPTVYRSAGLELVTYSGIDADYCGNIYIGDHSNIDILDTNFNITNVISLPSSGDTVYDLHISQQGNLYACGYGFVTSYFMPQSAVVLNKTSSPACSGCNGTALVSLSGCETGNFSWSNGNTGQFASNLCAGTYTVSVRLDCSTVISDTINIKPSPNPSVTIPGADVKEISCFNDNNGSAVALASGGTPPYTYMWYPLNIPNDTITNLTPGTYTFVVTDIHGCASIDTVTISQPSLLGVTAYVGNSIQAGQNATLTASASGGTPPYTYMWSDSSMGAVINPTPTNTTTYTVTVTDKDGCTSTAMVTVDVLCGNVFIPNVFSPNGDGHDDYLFVRGDCITNMTFVVFDRWGNKVFESTSLSKGWDGTYNGQPMNTGSYIWYLKATLKDGATIERKGDVTLVR